MSINQTSFSKKYPGQFQTIPVEWFLDKSLETPGRNWAVVDNIFFSYTFIQEKNKNEKVIHGKN